MQCDCQRERVSVTKEEPQQDDYRNRHAHIRLQRRRDVLCSALQEQGYGCLVPEGTFYITVRSPLEDDMAFCDILNAHDVYVLPGKTFEMPGWFRISVTANDEMVDRSIPGFAAAIQEARR